MQIQQGDVILKKVNLIPDGAEEREGFNRSKGWIVLAEGEATGHSHRVILTEESMDTIFVEKDGKYYLKNNMPVIVEHEEHKPITIEPGIWEVGQVREKDWLSGMVRKVVD